MSFIKNSLIYLFSSILKSAIPLMLLPILTKYMAPEEYGVLSIFQLMISFFLAFIGMNMSMNVSKNFFKYSKSQMALLIGNILIILCITTVLYFLLTFIVSFFYTEIFSVPIKWVLIVPVISFLMMINTLNLTVLRNEEKAVLFGVFEILNTLINIGVSIVLLVFYNYGWYSRAIGIITAYFVFFFVGLIVLRKGKYINLKYNKKASNIILKLSIPLIPHVIGGIILGLSDRIFIEHMVNIETVGIYSVGYMFGMVVILFTDAFIKAWSPWFYKTLGTETKANKKRIVKYSYLYILATFSTAIIVSIIAKWIVPFVVDQRYLGATEYVFWIAIGYAVHGVYKIFFPYLVYINKTKFLGFSTALAAVLNLFFNYFFIDFFGAIGAAYATVLSFVISTGLVICYQNKHYKMPWFKI